MKNNLVIVLWAALFAALLPAVSAVAIMAPCPSDPAAQLDVIWPLVDTNGDGGLSIAELDAFYPIPQQYFDILDANKDGVLTKAEVLAFVPVLESVAGVSSPLALIDSNGDGMVEFSEVSQYITKAQFDSLDANGDGVIECSDAPTQPSSGEGEGETTTAVCPLPTDYPSLFSALITAIDTDNDGGVSQDELLAVVPTLPSLLTSTPVTLEQVFLIVDANHDGQISLSELLPLVSLLPSNLVADIDTNGDGAIQFSEVSQYVSAGQFAKLDKNGDGVIDCSDVPPVDVTPVGEGEGEPAIDPTVICSLVNSITAHFSAMDADQDGGVSLKEYNDYTGMLGGVSLDATPLYAIADSNGDGELSLAELAVFDAGCGGDTGVCPIPTDPATLVEALIAALDTNGDGGVSQAELLAALPQLETLIAVSFDQLYSIVDTNQDGEISVSELTPYLSMLGNLAPIAKIDANGDGTIQFSEVSMYVSAALFAKLDKNGDGVLDCNDFSGSYASEGEGEGETPALCPLPMTPETLMNLLWPLLDANGDGAITLAELQAVAPQIPTSVFQLADKNRDGQITRDEVSTILPLANSMLISQVDTNGDGVIEFSEVSGYLSAAQFALLDRNGNGAIDCGDIVTTSPVEGEGEVVVPSEGEVSLDGNPVTLPAHLMKMLRDLLPLLDTDGDGAVSYAELTARFQAPQDVFNAFDTNGDGKIDASEILAALNGGGTGSGGATGGALTLSEVVQGNGYYLAGQTLTVVATIAKTSGTVSALGLWQQLPDGWSVAAVVDAAGAASAPAAGATGRIEFAWVNIPAFPALVVYTLNVPADATGVEAILGQALYRGTGEAELATDVASLPLTPAVSTSEANDADSDRDWAISLSELMRIIQIFNVGSYHCADGTEDGFAPGSGALCKYHSLDYMVKDGKIDLSELLRGIQFFNSPEHAYHVKAGSEDGFAAGLFSLVD